MIKPIVTWMKGKVIATLCILTISSTLLVQQARSDTISDVTTILANLTCETSEIANMIHGEFGHTCVPMPFATVLMGVVLNSIMPLPFYTAGIMTMNINNEKLFPNNCSRANRAIPYDSVANPDGPKIRFSFCNEILLRILINAAAADAVVQVAGAVVTGTNVWTAIQSALTLDPNLYNLGPNFTPVSSIGDGYKVGYGSAGDVWSMAGYVPLPVSVVQDNDRICVATMTVVGWMSMGCKYISEPFTQSKYANFFQSNPSSKPYTANTYTQCAGMNSCYIDANLNSQAMLPISGPLISCIRSMINQFLNGSTVCNADGSSSTTISTFFQFQLNMQRTVTALLTLYIIFFGFKLALGASEIKQADVIMFFVKFILVVYFSVGLNMRSATHPNGQQGFDGMTQWAFPIMFSGANDLAGWIMNASPSGLCQFTTNVADIPPQAPLDIKVDNGTGPQTILGRTSTQLNINSSGMNSTGGLITSAASGYAPGFEWLALWDALDCRLAHYIGLDLMGDATSLANQNDPSKTDSFNFSIPPYFFLLIPAILSGNVPLAMLAITYPVLVISVAAYVVNAFIICMIAIAILGILAPIFVPLALFSFTKGYFDSWVKLLLSFVLQPMVVATFMITLFTIYDAGFYGTCKYTKFTIPQTYADGSIINKSLFVVDSNPADYLVTATNDDWASCQQSLGYMINAPFAVLGTAASLAGSVGTTVSFGQSYDNFSAKFPILKVITNDVGLFFQSPTLAFQAIKNFIMSIMTACFCLYVMYQMSSQISEFAVDMVEGVSVGGAAIKPKAIMSKVQAGAQKMEDKLNERKVKPKDDKDKGGKDKPKSDDSAGAARGGSPNSQASDSIGSASASPKPAAAAVVVKLE